MTTPTMNKMLKAYLESAAVERLKCGRTNEGTVKNTLVGYRRFMRWMNDRRERCGHVPVHGLNGFTDRQRLC